MAVEMLLNRLSKLSWPYVTAIVAAGLFQATVELAFVHGGFGWEFTHTVVRLIPPLLLPGASALLVGLTIAFAIRGVSFRYALQGLGSVIFGAISAEAILRSADFDSDTADVLLGCLAGLVFGLVTVFGTARSRSDLTPQRRLIIASLLAAVSWGGCRLLITSEMPWVSGAFASLLTLALIWRLGFTTKTHEGENVPSRSTRLRPSVSVAVYLFFAFLLALTGIDGHWHALIAATNSSALGRLQIWVCLVGVQAICWIAILAWSAPHLRTLIAELPDRREIVTRCILPVVVLLIPWLVAGSINHAHGFPPPAIAGVPITGLIGPTGVFIAAVATFGLFVVFDRAQIEMEVEQPALTTVLKVGELIELFHQFLFAAATVLALGIVGTAALLKAARADKPDQFNSEFVVVFGVVGSLFLLAAFAPLRLVLYRQSTGLVTRALGQEPAGVEELDGWLDKRKSLEQLLGHDAASAFGLGGILTSLVPMVVGSVTKLLT